MYMELTPEDTYEMMRQLLVAALPKFEFPRQSLVYRLIKTKKNQDEDEFFFDWAFINKLTQEEINIISSYMIVEWIGQQLASIENVRMKYSGSDFKFTSQANHIHKLLQLKKDYEREGFHLQRLYKRRLVDNNGIYRSTFGSIMEEPVYKNTNSIASYDELIENETLIENFRLIRGDTFSFDMVISDLEDPIDDIFFTVKENKDDLDYIIQKTLSNEEIQLVENFTDRFNVKLNPQDTKDLEPGKYFYDLEVRVGNDIYTILMGTINIKMDITLHD